MEKFIVTLLMAVTLCLPAAARHGAQGQGRQSVAATAAVDTGAVVAYSDTTATDTAAYGAGTNATGTGVSRHYSFSIDDVTDPFNLIAYLATIGAGGVVVAIFFVILCLLVVFSPVILLVVILVMVSKRRSERYKVVEKAMETGRPVPDDIRPSVFDSKELLWRKGIRHIFIGIGLVALFWCFGWDRLTGVGLLVMLYGAGQAVIARTSARKDDADKRGEDVDGEA